MSSSSKITDYVYKTDLSGCKVKIQPVEGSDYTLHFDGGSRGNPGLGGCGWVLRKGGVEIYAGMAPLGKCTNNYAEYKGLECDEGVEFLKRFGVQVEKYHGELIAQ